MNGESCHGKTMVYKGNSLKKQDRESLEDDERTPRPNRDVTTHEMVMKLEICIRDKLRELCKNVHYI